MKKRFLEALHNLFVRNGRLKVVALVSAIALFSIAREQTTREVEIDVAVAVTKRPEGRVLVKEPPSLVRVRLRGNVQKLTEVLARRMPYELDLSGYADSQTGFFEAETLENHLGGGVKVLSVSPSNFEVKFDAIEDRRLPVVLNVIKGPGPYWTTVQEKTEIHPRVVKVTGPASVLSKIRQVHTEPLDLSTVTASFTGKVALEARDGVKLVPASVNVVIPVREKVGQKEIRGARIQVNNCPASYDCDASPTFYQATIQGKERVVDMITRENIGRYVYIDGSKLRIEKELLQKQFPAVAPTIEPLKDATISLTKARFFNITVTRR